MDRDSADRPSTGCLVGAVVLLGVLGLMATACNHALEDLLAEGGADVYEGGSRADAVEMCEQFVGDRIRNRPAGVRFETVEVADTEGFERSVWDVTGRALLPTATGIARLPYRCTVGHNDPEEWSLVGLCLRERRWAHYVHRSLHSSDYCLEPNWTMPGER